MTTEKTNHRVKVTTRALSKSNRPATSPGNNKNTISPKVFVDLRGLGWLEAPSRVTLICKYQKGEEARVLSVDKAQKNKAWRLKDSVARETKQKKTFSK